LISDDYKCECGANWENEHVRIRKIICRGDVPSMYHIGKRTLCGQEYNVSEKSCSTCKTLLPASTDDPKEAVEIARKTVYLIGEAGSIWYGTWYCGLCAQENMGERCDTLQGSFLDNADDPDAPLTRCQGLREINGHNIYTIHDYTQATVKATETG
jgi:hypothetical protein